MSQVFSRRPVALLSVTALLFADCLGRSLQFPEYLTSGLRAAGGLATICVALYNRDLRGFLSTKILLFMGRVSYSLYLLHATVLYVMLHLFSGILSKAIIFVLYIGVSFLVATFSYDLIERPSIALGRRLMKERAAPLKEHSALVSVP